MQVGRRGGAETIHNGTATYVHGSVQSGGREAGEGNLLMSAKAKTGSMG